MNSTMQVDHTPAADNGKGLKEWSEKGKGGGVFRRRPRANTQEASALHDSVGSKRPGSGACMDEEERKKLKVSTTMSDAGLPGQPCEKK
jgi:hypothetical protein